MTAEDVRELWSATTKGRWSRRDDEIAVELVRLEERMAAVRAAGVDRPPAAFTPSEGFVAGVRDASRWTRGASAYAPFLSDRALVVSDASVKGLVGLAERLLSGPPVVRHYAAGVRAWLQWLTGSAEVLDYPQD